DRRPRQPHPPRRAPRVQRRPPRRPELQVSKELNVTLKVWRQDGPDAEGHFDTIPAPGINDEMSFLEMLDLVNERLINEGKEAIVFDHDCREGICGTCSLMIDGQAHGPQKG